MSEETKELSAEDKRALVNTALSILSAEAAKGMAKTIGETGKLMGSLDGILANLAEKVKKTDENAPVWNLNMVPVTVNLADGKHQWIEILGLDRNARVQITDESGKCVVLITPKKAKSTEADAYFSALVESSKELTASVTVRKAVAGRTFRQVWAVAQKQEQDRIQKKYADICPPQKATSQVRLIKKSA